jgi:integrase
MTSSLFDSDGNRKYLVASERLAFARAARRVGGEIGTFCLTLAFTGARISELLALTPERIDRKNCAVVVETLKRRKRGVFRAIPVPQKLIARIERVHKIQLSRNPKERIWKWGRTTAWKVVKEVMLSANIRKSLAMPKAARHAFGADAIKNSVSLNLVQRWMGHARIETTAIYADVIGKEERALARQSWRTIGRALGY